MNKIAAWLVGGVLLVGLSGAAGVGGNILWQHYDAESKKDKKDGAEVEALQAEVARLKAEAAQSVVATDPAKDVTAKAAAEAAAKAASEAAEQETADLRKSVDELKQHLSALATENAQQKINELNAEIDALRKELDRRTDELAKKTVEAETNKTAAATAASTAPATVTVTPTASGTGTTVVVAGKTADDNSSTTVYVKQAPPADRFEIKPPRPSPSHTWVPGYWYWNGYGYAWISGYWTLPPDQTVIYVAPRYVPIFLNGDMMHPHGYRHEPGHWEPRHH